jgi:hypothetical protein
MSTAVSVPLSTAIADLDETLRLLMRRELTRHGLDEVMIAFDAPSKDWSAALATPTVNFFLYELRESKERRTTDWVQEYANGTRRDLRPPLMMEACYAVTAWTRAVEDEHRLLSQAIAILYAWPRLPADVLAGGLAAASGPGHPLATRVAQTRDDGRADFWLAVGGQYKASVDFAVVVPFEGGSGFERGPETRSRALRMRSVDGPRGAVEERHRVAGVVRDEDGAPVADVWVVLEERGFAASDPVGRFAFDGLPPGTYPVAARAPDGREATGEVTVPGGPLDLALGAPAPSAPTRRRR